MTKIAILIGTTRPNRVSASVGQWVHQIAARRTDADYELVDIADYDLPLLDEPMPPSLGRYANQHTQVWASKIAEFDGFVFVTGEYNHGIPGALKNAIDFVYGEWNNKAAGFVSYGSAGGVRSVEHLRGVCAELQVADVRAQVFLTLAEDFENYSVLKPRPHHESVLGTLLDQVVAWSQALAPLRQAG